MRVRKYQYERCRDPRGKENCKKADQHQRADSEKVSDDWILSGVPGESYYYFIYRLFRCAWLEGSLQTAPVSMHLFFLLNYKLQSK